MTVATPLIPGLDEFVMRGDPERVADLSRGIADLFVAVIDNQSRQAKGAAQ